MRFSEDVLKYLNLGIESEIAAYVFYRKVSRLVSDPGLRKAIDRFAHDEKQHFLTLEDEYDRHVRSEMWAPYKDILGREGLPDIDELVQGTHKELLARISALKTKKDILAMALALEQEAFDLFSRASARAKEPEAKRIFDHLAAFEKGHVNAIEKEIAAL